jgi:hypothetical protein
MPEWSDFEKVIAKIYETISPKAIVKHDDFIMGYDSGVKRQIDVSIRFREAGCDFLVIVQAKDYEKPANINSVGELAAVIKDVRASKGVLICNAGFTKGAQQLAASLGIDLCNAYDAETKNWNTTLTIPIVWERLVPFINFHVRLYMDAGDSISKDPTHWILSQDDGKTKLDIIGTFIEKWNAREIPRDPGRIHNILPSNENIKMLVGCKKWRPVDEFRISYIVKRNVFRKDVKTREFTGLHNYMTGNLEIGKLGVTLPPLNPKDGWVAIDQSIENLISRENLIITVEGPVIQRENIVSGDFYVKRIE